MSHNKSAPVPENEPYIMEVQTLISCKEAPAPLSGIIKIVGNKAMQVVRVQEDPCSLRPKTTDRLPERTTFIHTHLQKLGFDSTPEAFKELEILDIGCGSEYYTTFIGSSYPPNLCRRLQKTGASITGVDKRFPNKDGRDEGWKFHKLDLLEEDVLTETFPKNSFDIITANMILGHTDSSCSAPGFTSGFRDPDFPHYIRLEDQIFNQVIQILRPNGLFMLNHGESIYQKVLGKDHKYHFKLVHGNGFEDLPQRFLDVEALIFEGG
jgi:SAM-dependent methyltransferase